MSISKQWAVTGSVFQFAVGFLAMFLEADLYKALAVATAIFAVCAWKVQKSGRQELQAVAETLSAGSASQRLHDPVEIQGAFFATALINFSLFVAGFVAALGLDRILL